MNASEINIFFSTIVNKMYDFTNASSEKIYRKGWFNSNALCIKFLVNMPKVQFLVFVKFRNAIYSKQSIIINNTLNNRDVKSFLDNRNTESLILIVLENIIIDNNIVALSQLIKVNSVCCIIQKNFFHIMNCMKGCGNNLNLEILHIILSHGGLLKNYKLNHYLNEIMNLLSFYNVNMLSKKILTDIIRDYELDVNDLIVNSINNDKFNLLYLLLDVSLDVVDIYAVLKYCANVKCYQVFNSNICNYNFHLTYKKFNHLFNIALHNNDDDFMTYLLHFHVFKKHETERKEVLLDKLDVAINNNYPELTEKCLNLMSYNGIVVDSRSFNNLISQAMKMSSYNVLHVLFKAMNANIFKNNFDFYLKIIYNSEDFSKIANLLFMKILELDLKDTSECLDHFLMLESKKPVVIENLNAVIQCLIRKHDVNNFKKLWLRKEFSEYIHLNYYYILQIQMSMHNPSTELLKIFVETSEFKKYLHVFELIPLLSRDNINTYSNETRALCVSLAHLLDMNHNKSLKNDLMNIMFGNEVIKEKILRDGINKIFSDRKYLFYKIISDNKNVVNILEIHDICDIDLDNEIKCIAIRNLSWRLNKTLIEKKCLNNKYVLFDYAIHNQEKRVIEKILNHDHNVLTIITIDGIIPLFDIFINEKEEDKLCWILDKMTHKAIPMQIYNSILNKSCRLGLCKLTESLLNLPGVKEYATQSNNKMCELYFYIRESIFEYYKAHFNNNPELIKLFDDIQQKIPSLDSNDLNTLKISFSIKEQVKKDIGYTISQNIIYELNEFDITNYFNSDICDAEKYFNIIYAARWDLMINQNNNFEIQNKMKSSLRNSI